MMRFNAALARRVALILGLSFPTFCNALADGRAVLPPRWMVEAYLSDAVVKPSRDDIARAIIPGFGFVPAFLGGGGPDYASALAAIPNKTVILAADTSSASDGATLTSSPFPNAGSAGTNFVGSAVWKTGIISGKRVVRATATSATMTSSLTLSTLIGGDLTWSFWFVAALTGASNNDIIGDVGGYLWAFSTASTRQLQSRAFNRTGSTQNWGYSFTDGAPFVASAKVDASGNMRVNFNGATTSFANGFLEPWVKTGTFKGWGGHGASVIADMGEQVWSSDHVSDQVQDNFVAGLKLKWGIA